MLLRRVVMVSLVLLGASSVSADVEYYGSSTLYPVFERAYNDYRRGDDDVRFHYMNTLYNGFDADCSEISLSPDMLQPHSTRHKGYCSERSEYTKIPVAYDSISIIVNSANSWIDKLTLSELSRVFSFGLNRSPHYWSRLQAGMPKVRIHAVGVGPTNDRYRFFCERALDGQILREDYKAQGSDEETVKYVANTLGAIGFVSSAVADRNSGAIKVVNIDFGRGSVVPSVESVISGRYQRLSRKRYVYVNDQVRGDEASWRFLQYAVVNMSKAVEGSNFYPLPLQQYKENVTRLAF